MKSSITLITLCALFGLCTLTHGQSPEMKRRIEYRKQLNDPATRETALQSGLKDADPV